MIFQSRSSEQGQCGKCEIPPPVGSQIAFRYQELTDRGVPRFPSFVRVRSDAAA